MISKRSFSICGVIIIIMTLFFVFYGNAKQGMFLDELCSYIFANSKYEPDKNSFIENSIISQEEIIKALEVQFDERFDARSVYYMQAQDVHPPLYYLAVNFVSSIFCNSHSKWIGLGINYLLFVLIIFLIFLLAYRMFGTNKAAAIVTCLYTFSLAGMSMLIYIRMYTMLTVFTLLLAIEIEGLMHNNDKWYHYLAITTTVSCGLLTHYYFVIYAFFLCLSYVIFSLRKKTYRQLIVFSIAALFGVVVMVVLFPPVIAQLTSSELVSGTTAFSQLADIKMWFPRIGIHILYAGYFVLFAFVLVTIYFILLIKHRRSLSVDKQMSSEMMVILLPAFISFILVSIIAPYNDVRYIYNIIPIALFIVPFFYCCLISLNDPAVSKITFVSALMCLLLNICFTVIRKPNGLYEQDKLSNELVARYNNCKCLFFSSNGWAPIASALQLQEFNEIYLLGSSLTSEALEYIDSPAGANLVVFIDTDPAFGRELDPCKIINEILHQTEYCRFKYLFSNDVFSSAYLLSK